jgi:flagellar basal-body rod modification protein FlgD
VQMIDLKDLLMNHGASRSGIFPEAAKTAARANDASPTKTNTSASITSNDFLKLLVAEMKNQDPTATTDPNAYVDQLVQVNSLQQLIQINADLSGSQTTANGSAAISTALSKVSAALPHQVDNTAASIANLTAAQH